MLPPEAVVPATIAMAVMIRCQMCAMSKSFAVRGVQVFRCLGVQGEASLTPAPSPKNRRGERLFVKSFTSSLFS